MAQLVRDTAEQNSRARADRYYGSGRVVSLDTTLHTAVIDVNNTDTQGNPRYIQGVAFQPQTPPSVGDNVTLAYTSASSHSLYIAGGRLSGGNQQSTITTVGGVTSIAVAGHAKIAGDVTLTAGMNCTMTQTGNNITLDCSAAGMTVEIDGASATAAPRSLLNFLTGKGIHWTIADVPLSDRVDITLDALFGTITPTSINHASSPYTVGPGDFTIFANTSAGAITATLPSPAANNGRLVVLMNTGSPASAITVASAAGSVVGISSIGLQNESVWYISDGTNWYSFTFSGSTSGGGSSIPTNVLTILPGSGGSYSWAVPSAVTEFKGSTIFRAKHDLTNATQARLVLVVDLGAITPLSLPTLAVEYSTNNGSTWNYLDGSTGPSLTWGVGETASSWITLTGAAQADVLLRVVASGGNGSTNVSFGSLYVQVQ